VASFLVRENLALYVYLLYAFNHVVHIGAAFFTPNHSVVGGGERWD